MLKTPEMDAYDPSPMRLIAIHQNTEIQTALRGVPVRLLITVQIFEPGMSRSREQAKNVRARACYTRVSCVVSKLQRRRYAGENEIAVAHRSNTLQSR